MAIKLPASVFTKLNEAILLFNRTCTVVYPETREKCTNCLTNNFGGRSVNFYRTGGPIPFNRGTPCPLCGGEGFKFTETEEAVELRVYYQKKNFIDVGFEVCFWPTTINQKDINDMVLNGYSVNIIEELINSNKFSGLSAKMALSDWSKTSG